VSLNDGKNYQGRSALKIRLSIDRFEGEKEQFAVLLNDDGTQINFPRRLLHDRDLPFPVSPAHQ
jgi:hypothetical protein